jgi:hypothetical protein
VTVSDVPVYHVRREDVHAGSARDAPFASFDVVLRRDYDAVLERAERAEKRLRELGEQTRRARALAAASATALSFAKP